MGLCLVGRRPIHSKGAYSIGPGLNATFTFLCPRSSMTRPLVPIGLLTNVISRLRLFGFRCRIEQFRVSDLGFEFRPPNPRPETRDQKPTA